MNYFLPGAAKPSDNQLIRWKTLEEKIRIKLLNKKFYIAINFSDRGPKKSLIIPTTTAGKL
jgi:hypothetical protein